MENFFIKCGNPKDRNIILWLFYYETQLVFIISITGFCVTIGFYEKQVNRDIIKGLKVFFLFIFIYIFTNTVCAFSKFEGSKCNGK